MFKSKIEIWFEEETKEKAEEFARKLAEKILRQNKNIYRTRYEEVK